MNPSDANNLTIATDFDNDKILFVTSLSRTIANGASIDEDIFHNLPFRPLMEGYWSTDPNFNTRIPFSDSLSASPISAVGLVYTKNLTTFTLGFANSLGASTTFYMRIYAYAPHDYIGDADFTSSVAESLTYNSDYITRKIYHADRATVGSGYAYTHGLGYIPRVKVWVRTAAFGEYVYNQSLGSGKVSITTTNLSITGGTSTDIYSYRIYVDKVI